MRHKQKIKNTNHYIMSVNIKTTTNPPIVEINGAVFTNTAVFPGNTQSIYVSNAAITANNASININGTGNLNVLNGSAINAERINIAGGGTLTGSSGGVVVTGPLAVNNLDLGFSDTGRDANAGTIKYGPSYAPSSLSVIGKGTGWGNRYVTMSDHLAVGSDFQCLAFYGTGDGTNLLRSKLLSPGLYLVTWNAKPDMSELNNLGIWWVIITTSAVTAIEIKQWNCNLTVKDEQVNGYVQVDKKIGVLKVVKFTSFDNVPSIKTFSP
jgi:hypothetical protein